MATSGGVPSGGGGVTQVDVEQIKGVAVDAIVAGADPGTPVGDSMPSTTFGAYPEASGTGWVHYRVPTKSVEASGSAGFTLLTPTAGKKFRLFGYRLAIRFDASFASITSQSMQLQDGNGGAVMPGCDVRIGIPAAAGTAGGNLYDSGFVWLPQPGWLSIAANNIIKVNCAVTLAGGTMWAIAAYSEE